MTFPNVIPAQAGIQIKKSSGFPIPPPLNYGRAGKSGMTVVIFKV